MMWKASHPNEPKYPIGTVEITEPFEVTDRSYPTASWYQTLSCLPQTVVLWSNGYYVSYSVSGIVTDAYFGSSFGGVSIGKYDKSRDVGKHAKFTYSPYAFMFADAYMNGKLPADRYFHFLPEYGVGCAPYQHDPSKMGYFLTLPEAGHPLVVAQRQGGVGMFETHTYRVTWRGQRRASEIVKRSDGFNGDTRQVAIHRATETLDLPGMAL